MKTRRASWLASVGGAALAGLWLWSMRLLLTAPPLTQDAMLWLERGTGPRWWRWALLRRHFIGYRPLAALSYTLNDALTGLSTASLRAVDLSLLVGAGGLLFALARRWFGPIPALLAVALYFLHPATEEIALDVARRSYSLSAIFLLAGLLVLERSPHLAGLSILAAISSNEAAVIPALCVPLVMAWRAPERGWRAGWPALAAIAIMAILRGLILQGSGGYRDGDIVLPWAGATTAYSGSLLAAPLIAAAAAMYQTLIPASGAKIPSVLGQGPLGLGLAAIAAIALAHRLWRLPAIGRALLAWYAGFVLLSAVLITWFWRMAYPPLLVMGLAAAALSQRRDRAALAAGAVLGLNLLAQSPLIRGSRPHIHRLARQGEVISQIETALTRRPESHTVYLVLPFRKGPAQHIKRWLQLRQPDRDIKLAAYRHQQPPTPGARRLDPTARLTPAGEALFSGQATIAPPALPADAIVFWWEGWTLLDE